MGELQVAQQDPWDATRRECPNTMLERQGEGREVVLRAVGSHGRVLNPEQHSPLCVLERALWLSCGGWVQGDVTGAL